MWFRCFVASCIEQTSAVRISSTSGVGLPMVRGLLGIPPCGRASLLRGVGLPCAALHWPSIGGHRLLARTELAGGLLAPCNGGLAAGQHF